MAQANAIQRGQGRDNRFFRLTQKFVWSPASNSFNTVSFDFLAAQAQMFQSRRHQKV